MVSILLSALGQGITNYYHLTNAVIGWQAGGLVGVNWQMIGYIAPLIILSLCLAQLLSYHLTVLSLSESQAKALWAKDQLDQCSLYDFGSYFIISSCSHCWKHFFYRLSHSSSYETLYTSSLPILFAALCSFWR